ncbi:transposase family protein [Nonomuraea candida]|uniref:transposase family protein n=1 Tax=Nonomuraea candida TaxID=359159 RepID=UPI0034E0BD4F
MFSSLAVTIASPGPRYRYTHEGIAVLAAQAPDLPSWIAEVAPGSVHDLTNARAGAGRAVRLSRTWAARPRRERLRRRRNRHSYADQAARRNQILSPNNRTYNRRLRALRCLGERGFALLKGRWRTLRRFHPRAAGC